MNRQRKICREEIDKYLDAVKVLIVRLATSVPSERAFSTSGNIITAKRCLLAPELFHNLAFIAENARNMKNLRQ
ncbi:hypothetical protein PHMEG_00037107 [Phytophthora megakarya]|uniref:HAT C-terminal dimerisation domain-containing protein n=1 Tax=Phytophthora megakarya TaxID=4795 RepID=A0A225UKK6_9STRA|nr:hypothetical protein PHMEG_00037107 [Phytophthora megakarya]